MPLAFIQSLPIRTVPMESHLYWLKSFNSFVPEHKKAFSLIGKYVMDSVYWMCYATSFHKLYALIQILAAY